MGNTGVMITTLIAVIISIASLLLFVYENRTRQSKKKIYRVLSDNFDLLQFEHKRLNIEHEKLNVRENILSQIIDCVNMALEDEHSFQISMKELARRMRFIYPSEYCAIGKIVNNIVEDYACDYEEYTDNERQHKQQFSSNKARKVNIDNVEYLVCETLKNKGQQICVYDDDDIRIRCNDHYELYKHILKSGHLSNTTIIPLRDDQLENHGYIQFINSEDNISLDDVGQFQEGLLKLVQLAIKKEEDRQELDRSNKFTRDSDFIRTLIKQKDDVDKLLDNIMEYLSQEFNAAVISFRIPVLNGKERKPLFYLRRCFVHLSITNSEQIKGHYQQNRILKNKYELGGYDILRCSNRGNIISGSSIDSDYYSAYGLDLKEQTLIMPVLKDVGKYECLRIKGGTICEYPNNQECVERFKKLYGLFKLRLFKDNEEKDIEIIRKEEKEFNDRLSYLSAQITLIFDSIVDKSENASLKIFRDNLNGQQFLKIRDFDKQFVEIIKNPHMPRSVRFFDIEKMMIILSRCI
jgi:hypothetical protein